ncbi:MAG: hypothetical protein WBW92_13850 [Rhodanobacteraceae bacterium]
MRRVLLACASMLLWTLLVLGWAADIRHNTPWQAEHTRQFAGQTLHSIAGDASRSDKGLRVSELGKYAQGLQSWQLADAIDADRMTLLRYRLHHFPRTLELALIFRTRSKPDDVQSVTLPWPGTGASTLDLSQVAGWRGQVIELGFSEYPMPGQTPPGFAFQPFVLQDMSLHSRSIGGLWHALVTRFLAWNAWSMRSINANQSATPYHWRSAPNSVLALVLGGSVLIAWLFGLLRGGGGRVLLVALVAGWLLLDLGWLGQMQRDHALSKALYAGKPWTERSTVIADRPLQRRAEQVRAVLARQQPGIHVLYWTPGQTDSVRLGFFLRPYNVAPLPPGMASGAIPDGNLLLIDDQDMSWQWDGFHSRLSRGGYAIHGDLLWRQGDMLLLSVRSGAGA